MAAWVTLRRAKEWPKSSRGGYPPKTPAATSPSFCQMVQPPMIRKPVAETHSRMSQARVEGDLGCDLAVDGDPAIVADHRQACIGKRPGKQGELQRVCAADLHLDCRLRRRHEVEFVPAGLPQVAYRSRSSVIPSDTCGPVGVMAEWKAHR